MYKDGHNPTSTGTRVTRAAQHIEKQVDPHYYRPVPLARHLNHAGVLHQRRG
ncbi:MAG: hypothetical protein LC662_12000 [Rhodothermaceae bacterium]|nr:hypothetical protein [Rhodothermaceae bacterium]